MKAIVASFLSLVLATPALANGSEEQMASAFKAWCGNGTPSFEAVDKKAQQKKTPLDNDINPPMDGGRMIASKTWANNDATGVYAVNASRAINGDKHVQGCGVYFPDIHEDITDYLSTTLALGKPYKRLAENDGKHLSYWNGAPNTLLMFTLAASPGMQGASLNSIQTLEPGK